jgi:hypothetical protein
MEHFTSTGKESCLRSPPLQGTWDETEQMPRRLLPGKGMNTDSHRCHPQRQVVFMPLGWRLAGTAALFCRATLPYSFGSRPTSTIRRKFASEPPTRRRKREKKFRGICLASSQYLVTCWHFPCKNTPTITNLEWKDTNLCAGFLTLSGGDYCSLFRWGSST